MKRVLIWILAALLLSLPAKASAAEPNEIPSQNAEDVLPPVLKTVQVLPSSIEAPGSFGVTAEAEDDLSGIKTLEVNFEAGTEPNVQKLHGVLSYDETAGNYQGTIQVETCEASMTFRLMSVVLEDQASNRAVYRSQYVEYADPPYLPQEVTVDVTGSGGESADTAPPVLHTVTADCSQVDVPGSFLLTAEVSDDLSGVLSVNAELKAGTEQDAPSLYEEFLFDPETGSYQGTFHVTEEDAGRTYCLWKIGLADRAGNTVTYGSSRNQNFHGLLLPNEPEIQVGLRDTAPEDLLGPVLKSIRADQQSVTAPGTFRLMAEAEDDFSEIASVQVQLRSKTPGDSSARGILLQQNPETGLFEGSFHLEETEKSGELFVSSVYLTDGAGNTSSYRSAEAPDLAGQPLPNEVSITVNPSAPETEDTAGPVLISIQADPVQVTIPGTVHLTASASDDLSGIRSILVRLVQTEGDGTQKFQDLFLQLNQDTGQFEGSMSLTENHPEGKIFLLLADLTDQAGNVTSYHSAENRDLPGQLLPAEVEITVKKSEFSKENTLILRDPELQQQPGVYVDGIYFPVITDEANAVRYLDLKRNDYTSLITFSYHKDSEDPHSQYPTGMKVWLLTCSQGAYHAEYVPEYENLLQYSGSSIRITGKKGIRMITSVPKIKREALIAGKLHGSRLLEYGTALAWSDDLEAGNPLTLGSKTTKANFAYRTGKADPIFRETEDLIQYTNVLVGFQEDDCRRDLAMRPYLILKDHYGREITLYGGIVRRSIGYIASQNLNAFPKGSAADRYVRDIVRYVYG